MSSTTVAERIREGLGRCSPAERRVGRALLADYPAAGLDTVAKLALSAETSGPTVLRFLSRLGFDGFGDLQHGLRAELGERDASPLAVLRGDSPPQEGDALGRARALLPESLARTLEGLPPDEVDRAVRLLADRRARVTVEGGRFTRLLASYLVLHLMQVRGNARLLPEPSVERADALFDMGRRDVVVLFDFRRYEPATAELAARCSDAGASVVLVTDRWLSPVAGVADVVLPVRVDAIAVYDSLVPALALVEVLVAGVLERAGDRAHERLTRFEEIAQRFGVL
ncbi:MurR/RpiR family transcriptional regulator [uncultured Nocardioides sp.]|uniref:Transcriptional regulator, RpiR family n=1 Tax=uncultured Nocardioides sp. TaxID=198441 RepID=A0A6J4N5P4_9ACTN|nr:MurR/RpiR family transcriptional regulator [uncultured Nocardioides sp.]CAA9377021.1 MAG: Transcriptional regulator, RpiR family [uncultured Nocardioides sp.]